MACAFFPVYLFNLSRKSVKFCNYVPTFFVLSNCWFKSHFNAFLHLISVTF